MAFLLSDEKERVVLTSMVACLFARKVYTPELLKECLVTLGYTALADNLDGVARVVQKKRWQLRRATGFKPEQVRIPKRYLEVTTWKGKTDPQYLDALISSYARAIEGLAQTSAGDHQGG